MNENFSISARIAATALTASGVFFVGYANTSEPTMEIGRVGVERYRVSSLQVTNEVRVLTEVKNLDAKSPRARLVADLRAIRQRAIAKGMRLKSMDEIRAEIEAARELGA